MTVLPSTVPPAARARAAFTLMEILVVIAIILVLAAIAFPVISGIQMRSHKAVALQNMRQITSGCLSFAADNDGTLPAEDSKGTDTWENAAKDENAKAWYNAVPRKLGQKGVGDYVSTPRDFYRKENILFLPGATYPDEEKRIKNPLFAIAINTKLSRKNEEGKKEPTKLAQITHASKTVLFLEQGLPKETTTVGAQSKKDYDGAPKGSAKSFIGRYGGEGILTFADGSAGAYQAKELLTETGRFPFPQTEVIWTRTPDEDPNKTN